MPSSSPNSADFYVRINAESAVKELRTLLNSVSTVQEKIQTFSQWLLTKSQEWGVPWQKVLTAIRQVNAELSKQHRATVFGNTGGIDLGAQTQQYMQSVQAAAKANQGLNQQMTNGKAAGGQMAQGLDKASKSAKGFHSVLNLIRGTLVAIGVFRVIEGIQQFFTDAIEGARNLELAMYNLANAERIISKGGIGITPEDLKEIAAEVEKLVPIFSHVDVSNAVAGIALFTKDLRLSKEQIMDLSKSIAVLTVRNRAFGLSFEQVRSQVLTGLLTGRAQGIRDLGVSVSETTVQAEALRLGLVKDKKAFDALSGEMEANVKAQALVSIITKSTTGEIETMGEYLSTTDAKLQANTAAWKNFATTVGTAFKELLPDLTGVFDYLQKAVEQGTLQRLINQTMKDNALADRGLAMKVSLGIKLNEKEYAELKKELSAIPQDVLKSAFPDTSAIKDRFVRELVESLIDVKDTATGAGDAMDGLADSMIDLQAALDNVKFEDFIKDLAEMREKMREAEEEFNLDRARELEDYNLDRVRDEEDHLREEQKIIEDAAEKRHEAEEEYRNKEKEAEAKFQENMRQLREKFLYNLEDALRERDARQILRLIREYQMEKQNLTNEEAIRKKFAAEEHARELEEMREDEADRLAELDREFAIEQQRKAEDFALKQARAAEDHAKEMEELRTRMDEKLKEFAAKLAEELGLREGAADDIYKMLKDYYGEGGKFDELYAYSANSMIAYTQAMIDALSSYLGQVQGMATTFPNANPGLQTYPISPAPPSSGNYTPFTNPNPGLQTYPLAPYSSSPTSAVNSAGMSSASSTLNRAGVGGQATMVIRLTDGLKAEIVDSALNDMAVVIEQTQRSMA